MTRQLPILLFFLLPTLPLPAVTLDDEVEASLHVAAVAGREQPGADFIAGRLAGLPASRDALGNVVLTVGTGGPRRLFACTLGEPGLIVTEIREDGYLRVAPVGGPVGTLWPQAYQGQTVVVGGARGWIPGAVPLPSVHLMQGGGPPETPFRIDDLYVDVGAESAAEAAETGVRLLDPVALIRRPARLAGGLLAGPYATQRAACTALADTARRLAAAPGRGTTVFAWTTNDLVNGAGLVHLTRRQAPFEEVILLASGFGWERGEESSVWKPLPNPGSGLLGAGELPPEIPSLTTTPHFGILDREIAWGNARKGLLGLPAKYAGTPVETISLADVRKLADSLVRIGGGNPATKAAAPSLSPVPPLAETGEGYGETARLLGSLIARYGVSGAEGPVREEIRKNLLSGVKPEIDGKGNVSVTVGSGGEHILFVAHMDEVGFRVEEVLPDGRLRLQNRGGLLRPAWEAQAALVHGERGPVPGVFQPREDWWTTKKWGLDGPLTVDLGVSSAQEAETLGVRAGSTVTMPKKMLRIGRHRVLARSFDDRVGSTALLLALRQIDPAKLGRRVTFAWAVEEEVGLEGSRALAARMGDLTAVHPVDTFVSSDSPLESHRFAFARLGKGPVLRGMDNGFLAPREVVDHYRSLAERSGIPVQVGFTGGATDGMAFLANGPVMLPFSWPGRHSHSPVEVADLRDVEALVRLVVAVATEERNVP